MKYPADIVTEDGWARIHQGHGLDVDAIRADFDHHQGPLRDGQEITVEEVHMVYRPHVKWCGKYDWPCDMEGDWHGHWYGVKANPAAPETRFTIVRASLKPAAVPA